MKPPLHIIGQKGLGDSIYARPFIKDAASRYELFLTTPWPELYSDLPVRFVRPETQLRTQAKNVAMQESTRWVDPPPCRAIQFTYGAKSLRRFGSIMSALRRIWPLESYQFDLPLFDGCLPFLCADKPIAFVRPVTTRAEWCNTARNPKPEYIAHIAAHLMQTHRVVLVADIERDKEWIEGELPPHHAAYLRGELRMREMLLMLAYADVAVGGVGWLVPASIALGVKAFIVLGGQGGHNAPSVITDPGMNLDNIHFATPKDYCQCANMKHDCPKEIPDLATKWNLFARSRALPPIS